MSVWCLDDSDDDIVYVHSYKIHFTVHVPHTNMST